MKYVTRKLEHEDELTQIRIYVEYMNYWIYYYEPCGLRFLIN